MEASSTAVRINPFKKAPLSFQGAAVPWSPYGMVLSRRPSFTLDPLFHAGAYYVQDSSAMYIGHLFRKALAEVTRRHEGVVRVLDLCAAPGGKTTDIAASLREKCGSSFLLVSNEVMQKRAAVLCDNVARWGDPNVVVTGSDPSVFGRELPGCFDIIVADVPCSGEGMFRKNDRAVREWGEDTVELCAARQKRILADVWPALKPGGILVYSTCTFEEAENDANVEWAAEELGGQLLDNPSEFEGVSCTRCGYRLDIGMGEGQWGAMLRKDGDYPGPKAEKRFGNDICRSLRLLWKAPEPGRLKGRDFIPEADWALSLDFDPQRFPIVEVDKALALKYLHRDSFPLPGAAPGYNVISYGGLPLGFVKNLGSRCNNLLPQGRRILMDIPDTYEQ